MGMRQASLVVGCGILAWGLELNADVPAGDRRGPLAPDQSVSPIGNQPFPDHDRHTDYDAAEDNAPSVLLISGEQPNGIAERVYYHYSDADIALHAYATADIGGCTGTMIGPNVLMSAGHCGNQPRTARFYVYPDADTKLEETFNCEYLLHTFPDMDLVLYWVFPNEAGEHAGDKYGYVDFDVVIDPSTETLDYAASRALIATGVDLYSVWTNPIDSIGNGWHAIFSRGTVTATNVVDHWASPNLDTGSDYLCGNSWCVGGPRDGLTCDACNDPGCGNGTCMRRPNRHLGVDTNMWSNPGASGSTQLTVAKSRALLGPLSIGTSNGMLRRSPGIADYCQWGYIDRGVTQAGGCRECDRDQLNETLLPQLGLGNPSDYYGWIDLNLNGMFDIHELLELVRGETTRPFYWLGFESLRRTKLWNHGPRATFDTANPLLGLAILDTQQDSGTEFVDVMWHRRLPLTPGRAYVLRFDMAAVVPGEVRVCLNEPPTDCHTFEPPFLIPATYVYRFTAGADPMIRFLQRPNAGTFITSMSLQEVGTPLDFDSHDKRLAWRNPNTNSRGRAWPNGRSSPTRVDWAGAVVHDRSQPFFHDWPLETREVPLEVGGVYRVQFDYRLAENAPLSLAAGQMRVADDDGLVVGSYLLFDPTGEWNTLQTDWFAVDSSATRLQFGVWTGNANAQGAYLIDNIRFHARTTLGDMNCDGTVSVGDINPFVLALTDPVAYAEQYPDCELLNGDCSGDGGLSVGDINCFVALVTGS